MSSEDEQLIVSSQNRSRVNNRIRGSNPAPTASSQSRNWLFTYFMDGASARTIADKVVDMLQESRIKFYVFQVCGSNPVRFSLSYFAVYIDRGVPRDWKITRAGLCWL